ncbi:MAG: elongation factor P [Alteromonas naphthalenivorans]|jgi:elongation factor P
MISASDLRKGNKILHRDEPHIVMDFHHNKMGRGGAIIRAKLKNLISGSTFEETFRSDHKFADPQLERKQMQYLYVADDLYNFMDQETFDQVSLDKGNLEDVMGYIKEEEIYDMLYFDDKPIGVTPPLFMVLEVKETPPGVRGDTAKGGATKTATLETGINVQVPLFVNEGDKIKLDTRDGSYIERA